MNLYIIFIFYTFNQININCNRKRNFLQILVKRQYIQYSKSNIIITYYIFRSMTSQTKEAMQNNIKNLQAKSENINKIQDKGSKVVVLQLGSHTIKMGFANERVPFTLRPFIAYKKKQAMQEEQNQPPYVQKFDYEHFKTSYNKLEQELKMQGIVTGDKPFKGKPKNKTVTAVQTARKPNIKQPVLFGEQALFVQDNPNFIVKKPIQHGFFNIEKQEDFQSQLSDVENLIYYLMREVLKIPASSWNAFSCILVVPDVFVRMHVKQMIKMLFVKIGFRRLYVHLESVMACFGTAISSACVVDIGHQKIQVCCVDEGVIVPKSMIRKNFGSKDISKGLIKLISDRLNPDEIDKLEIAREGDLNQIDKVKQIACAIREGEQNTSKIYEIYPVRDSNEIPVHFNFSDSFTVISNSFFSDMWNAFPAEEHRQNFDSTSELFGLRPDPEDYFEEYSGGGQVYQIGKDHPNYSSKIVDQFTYQPVENLIWESLASIKDFQIRKKFANNILIVGGGSHMLKLPQQIISKLNKKVQYQKTFAEKFELATDLPLREIAPIYASYLGGTVIPKLDSLRDLWIQRNKFIGSINSGDNQQQQEPIFQKKYFTRKEQSQQWGIKYLKEKTPFLW